MSEESTNNEETQTESQQEIQEDSKKEGENKESVDLKNRVSTIEKKYYDAKKQELLDLEKRLDKKMASFRELVSDAEAMGVTSAGQGRKSQEEKDGEEAEEIVNSLMA
jgi:hypothetical protein